MTRRRQALQAMAAWALAPSLALGAATPSRPRVAIQRAGGVDGPEPPARWKALFADQGLVDGRDIDLEFLRLGGKDPAVRERRARELVDSRPQVILVPGSDLIALFKGLTREIPIVFYSFGENPVQSGLVDSYRLPGGNVTGTTNQAIEIHGKGWELLKLVQPGARRAGSLWPESSFVEPWIPAIRAIEVRAAAALGLERVEIVVRAEAAFALVEEVIRRARVDILSVVQRGPWTSDLMAFLEKEAIPALWEVPADVAKGGLMAVIGSYEEALRLAVSAVASILRGREPGTIPIQEVTRIDISINLRTARAMKLAIPPDILLRANRVFE